MLRFLKDHPFAVEAFFESTTVFTFAFPCNKLAPLIPPCLSLDTFKDSWAFIAVAMVRTKSLRPKGFPEIVGNDFFLTGYRIFVRYKNLAGKNLRGLYILKSETDSRKMELLGNIFTHYNYSTIDIHTEDKKSICRTWSKQSGFDVSYARGNELIDLPVHSVFSNWEEARRFAGPLPFTFTYDPGKKVVLIIEGVRKKWNPVPLTVLSHSFSFLDKLDIGPALLVNAFEINNIPYYWKKGKKEIWSS